MWRQAAAAALTPAAACACRPGAKEILGHCLFSAAAEGSLELTEALLQAARAAEGTYPEG